MFAIKVNGVNFWEEAPGCGHEKYVDLPRSISAGPVTATRKPCSATAFDWVAGADVTLENAESAALLSRTGR